MNTAFLRSLISHPFHSVCRMVVLTAMVGLAPISGLAAVPGAPSSPNDAMDRVGLVRSWVTTLPVDRTQDVMNRVKFVIPADSHPAFYLDEQQLDVLLNNPDVSDAERERFLGNLDVWVTLSTEKTREVVSSRDRGLNGRVLGIDGALRLAEIRQELLTGQGLEVTRTIRFIPKAMVFALNGGGVLQAMDAETGTKIWSRRLVKGRAPIQGYAVSDHTVAIINGSRLELYDAMTGTFLKDHPVSLLPWGPPAIAGNEILVTGANGRIELLIPFGEDSYRSAQGGFSGRMEMPLTELNRSFVWGVKEAVYVSDRLEPARPLFRIPTSRPLSIPPAGIGNLMVLPMADGDVKCFTQTSGLSAWTTFIGQGVTQSPTFVQLPAGDGQGDDEDQGSTDPATGQTGDAGGNNDPFGNPTDPMPSDDPFGNPPPAAGNDDPFGDPSTPPPAPAGQDEGGDNDDPFGGSPAQEDDPFGGDPFSSGADDPFGGDSSSPFSGGIDAADEVAPSNPTIRRSQTVDMASVLPTQDEVRVLLVTESGDLIALDLRTGAILQSFRAGNIQKVLTVTNKFIYAMTIGNDLVALDVRTGVTVGQMPLSADWHGVENPISDRVYLQNDNGQVVCMRPRSAIAPRYAVPANLEQREIRVGSDDTPEAPAQESGNETFDLFGGDGADPFGSGGDDPFK